MHEGIAAKPSTLVSLLRAGARLTTAAQLALCQVLVEGDVVVDATCGNGHDTVWLAEAVGPSGVVYGFDLQESAVAATSARLHSSLPQDRMPTFHVQVACHSRMLELVGPSRAKAVVFNLGYLPGSDKSLTTQTTTTLSALNAALEVVMPGGLVSVLCYTGHEGGPEECQAVRDLLGTLPPHSWVSSETRLMNRPTAPILMLVWRQADAAVR